MPLVRSAASAVFESLRDAVRVSRELYTIMVPVIILVKILQELDLIRYLAWPLKPLMTLVGLPAEMGLAWAAALLNSVYSGLIIFLQLAQSSGEPLTVAQVTTLGTMMLIAHALPIEGGVARKCGARFFAQATIRVGTALVFGLIFHAITSATDTLGEAAAIPLPFDNPAARADLTAWAFGEVRKLLWISTVIFAMLLAMKLLRRLGILQAVSRALEPMMRLIGIGPKAATITMIGMTLGMSYGSGLIVQDVRKGELGPEDVFCALSFMGVCHSLVEDTLLILLIGGHLSGVLWLRLALSLLLIATMVRLVRRLPLRLKTRFLWVERPSEA
jgi:hypothetical protein